MQSLAARCGLADDAVADAVLANRTTVEGYVANRQFSGTSLGAARPAPGSRQNQHFIDSGSESDDDEDLDADLDAGRVARPASLNDVLLGNGIKHNGGFPLQQLNKLPSYSFLRTQLRSGSGSADIATNGTNTLYLNKLLLKLPVADARGNSAVNGLPFYQSDRLIHNLQSIATNEQLEQVELTHLAVICNQFVSNKRRVRARQWTQYYGQKQRATLLDTARSQALKANYVSTFNRRMLQRREKLIETNKLRQQYQQQLKQLVQPQPMGAAASQDDIQRLQTKLEELNDTDFDSYPPPCADDDPTPSTGQILRHRFKNDLDADLSVIVEKELSVDNPNLVQYQVKLLGQQKAMALQQSIKNSNGVINTNVVRFKWTPNGNSLGFGNIRRRKPRFLN